jgi:hypothetical protein
MLVLLPLYLQFTLMKRYCLLKHVPKGMLNQPGLSPHMLMQLAMAAITASTTIHISLQIMTGFSIAVSLTFVSM